MFLLRLLDLVLLRPLIGGPLLLINCALFARHAILEPFHDLPVSLTT